MKDSRITAKELGLIKGSLRRVFSRSDTYKEVIKEAIVTYSDPTRPRVKTWCKCSCGKIDAKSYLQVDHKVPVVPLNRATKDMTVQELADRIWCLRSNLQAICKECHYKKSALELKERAKNRKQTLRKARRV